MVVLSLPKNHITQRLRFNTHKIFSPMSICTYF